MADEFDPNKITDLSQAMEQRGLEKAHSDLRVSILEETRKREELSAEHSWNYEIGDRVVTAETANLPNPTPWKIIGKYINEKGLLEGSKPREGKLIEGLNVPYYRVSRIEDVGTPEEGEHITALPEWAIQNKFGTPGLVSDKPPPSEPRSTALVPSATAPSAEDPAKEKAWKPSLKGLGSFVRSLATKGPLPLQLALKGLEGLGALKKRWDNLSQAEKEKIIEQSSALEEGLQASRDERLGTELEGGIAALPVKTKGGLSQLILDFLADERGALGGRAVDPFYSKALQYVENSTQGSATGAQWKSTLENAGIKKEEMAWLGLDEFFASPWQANRPEAISREDLASYIRANQIEVRDVTKGGEVRVEEADGGYRVMIGDSDQGFYETRGFAEEAAEEYEKGFGGTKFSTYVLPGGENYRELLLTMPVPKPERADFDQWLRSIGRNPDDLAGLPDEVLDEIHSRWADYRGAALTAQEKADMKAMSATFTGGHWDEPNTLAWIRFNERTVGDERVLFVEEMQSDWHQRGRKQGYMDPANAGKIEVFETTTMRVREAFNTNEEARTFIREQADREGLAYAPHGQGILAGVPDAPFKGSWHELAFRRMVRYAAENDFDRIAWITGEQTADRYNLSTHLVAIDVIKNQFGFFVQGFPKDFYARQRGPTLRKQVADEDELANTIGKEIADRVIKKGNEGRFESGVPVQLRGLDLKVGGEWAVNLYDKALQNYARKFGKKFGAKVEDVEIETELPPKGHVIVHSEEGYFLQSDTGMTGPFDTEEAAMRHVRNEEATKIGTTIHSMTLTDKMRETAMKKGFPLFSAGGLVAGAGFAGLEAGREDGEEIQMESILEPSLEGPRIVKAHGGFIDKPLYERTL